jgi:hypothetical protein
LGQQQLLLIVLGILIVGIAVIIGINVFRVNAIEQKRNYLISECMTLGSMAQQYWLKPATYGGGSRSYDSWTIPASLRSTSAGTYKIDTQEQNSITIIGIGNEVVTGNDTIKVSITVPQPPQDYIITVIN